MLGVLGTTAKAVRKLNFRRKSRRFICRPLYTPEELQAQRQQHFPTEPLFSIIVPLYNTPGDFLEEMLQSVLAQTYSKWELCLADGSDNGTQVEDICRRYAREDDRIHYRRLPQNLGISGNTNACLDMAAGDYICLFDHDDLLHPAALFSFAKAIHQTGADFLYTDELIFTRTPAHPKFIHFKPDYSPENLLSNNYICHFSAFRKSLLDRVGPLRSQYDGSQDHEFYLRATAAARKVVHIPQVLYYWRSHANSVARDLDCKAYAFHSGRQAVTDFLAAQGLSVQVESTPISPVIYRIHYPLAAPPPVSVLIPGNNNYALLSRCVESILENNTYPNSEILIVDNGSSQKKLLDYYEQLQPRHPNVRVLSCPWQTFPQAYALGAGEAKGELLLLLNPALMATQPGWIEEMVMLGQKEQTGCVGARICFPNQTIAHAGLLILPGEPPVRAFYRQSAADTGYMGRLHFAQQYSAVSGACMLVKKDLWMELGSRLPDDGWDVCFCLRLEKAGYRVLWTPWAKLTVKKTRHIYPRPPSPVPRQWCSFPYDPCYNPNFCGHGVGFVPKARPFRDFPPALAAKTEDKGITNKNQYNHYSEKRN